MKRINVNIIILMIMIIWYDHDTIITFTTIQAYSISRPWMRRRPLLSLSWPHMISSQQQRQQRPLLYGWIERNGEWEWVDDDDMVITTIEEPAITTEAATTSSASYATPQLPKGTYRPKQSLGQNYLKDPNTVLKIIQSFHHDATTQFLSSYPLLLNNGNTEPPEETITMTNTTRNIEVPIIKKHNNNKMKTTTFDINDKIVIELGPGLGALTNRLIERYGAMNIHCIEIDTRSIQILQEKYPNLYIKHQDVLQVNYFNLTNELLLLHNQKQQTSTITNATIMDQPLVIIGNLPYYITSQILFALLDAHHDNLIHSATVTMQKEVAMRMRAIPNTKDYGILSVVFQIYCSHIPQYHYTIPPTVFYPKPKVDSALIGLHFLPTQQLQQYRLCGVSPAQLRTIVTLSFQQRRKTLKNSLKQFVMELLLSSSSSSSSSSSNHTITYQDVFQAAPLPLPYPIQYAALHGDTFAQQQSLPIDWSMKRPEQLTSGQFIELTRLIYHTCTTRNDDDDDNVSHRTSHSQHNNTSRTPLLGKKVWRKLKHG